MFRTALIPHPSKEKISLSAPILSIGSCFSDCMGERFLTHKFNALANPFGTVYNPVSIFKLLNYTEASSYPDAGTYVETQEMCANFDFHSSFSTSHLPDIRQNIHAAIDKAANHLKKTEWIIITFGTAFVYRRTDNNELVANCHKLPASYFSKDLLTQEVIIDAFKTWYDKVQASRPDLKIILTVSPVRHIKDSLEQNSLSKAILRVACGELSKAHAAVQYFPSYEIMMDDLRDYRFYKSDMIHPTKDAEDYIWQKFAGAYFDEETQRFIEEWNKILKAIKHRPFNAASAGHQKFLNETIARLNRLKNKVDVSNEIHVLQDQLVR